MIHYHVRAPVLCMDSLELLVRGFTPFLREISLQPNKPHPSANVSCIGPTILSLKINSLLPVSTHRVFLEDNAFPSLVFTL